VARGTLRIYLGAAPGVGKTFDMLGEAHRRLSRGTDVVVGLVETHGRRRTASMRPRSRAPWLLLAGGAAIVPGRGPVSGHGWPDRGREASAGRRPDQKGFP
jgi:hypothetical protein